MESDIYIFTIHSTFFEFIHVDNMEEENPPTLFIDQVYTIIQPKQMLYERFCQHTLGNTWYNTQLIY